MIWIFDELAKPLHYSPLLRIIKTNASCSGAFRVVAVWAIAQEGKQSHDPFAWHSRSKKRGRVRGPAGSLMQEPTPPKVVRCAA
jgi:hypothetical protein